MLKMLDRVAPRIHALALLVPAAITVLPALLYADGGITVRFGEQDTCKITGVTAVTSDAKAGTSQIKFDLSKLPKDAKIVEAKLRLWVRGEAPFDFERWNNKDFDGFKAWQIGKDEKPLDICFPFDKASFACQEWDVTAAVKDWAANPAANQGLRLNCLLPANDSEPAWRRPFLQITCAGEPAAPPSPPTDLKAFYRSGQVFLTWKNIPYDGAFFESAYRIYLHTAPITAANLSKAVLVGEVYRNSQLNYRRTVYQWDCLGAYSPFNVCFPFLKARLPPEEQAKPSFDSYRKLFRERYNFVIDDSWPEKSVSNGQWLTDMTAAGEGYQTIEGAELPDDAGLFVHTVKQPGSVYFAVTSVIEGQENRKDIRAENSLARPLDVKVEPPRPILQMVFNSVGRNIQPTQFRMYTYWGGGDDGLHSVPGTPFMLQVYVPWDYVTKGNYPSTTQVLYGNSVYGDLDFPPPTPRAPFPSLCIRPDGRRDGKDHWIPGWKFYYGSKQKPADPMGADALFVVNRSLMQVRGNFFGYLDRLNTGLDPRQAVVVPYLENRIFAEIAMYLALFPKASRNEVIFQGERSYMNIAMHHGDKVASISSVMDTPWTSKRVEEDGIIWKIIGRRDWNLKTPEGFSAWDWNDPVWFSKQFPLRDWPFINTDQSVNYDRTDNLYNWQDMGYPDFYKALEKEKRAGWWMWATHGDAPGAGAYYAPLNEPIPAIANATCCQQPKLNWRDERVGTLTGYIEWHHGMRPFMEVAAEKYLKGKTPPPGGGHPYLAGYEVQWLPVSLELVDQPDAFEMALRINARGLFVCTVDTGMADVTPRRLQKFKVVKGQKYAWKNVQTATGRVLQSGVITPDDVGLLTVPQVAVDRSVTGNKLIITAGDAAGAADTASPVILQINRDRAPSEKVELAFADYMEQCRNPELVKLIRAGRVFRAKDFRFGGSPDGEFYSEWGVSFGDAFEFPEAGRYRVDANFRRAVKHAGAWPMVNCSAAPADRQGVVLDSDKPRMYSWWIDMDAPGRKNVDFTLGNRTFNSPAPHQGTVNGKPIFRGFSLENVTFVPLGKRPDKVAEILRAYIVTRSIETGVDVPVQLRAEAQDAWGETLDKKPAWSVSGGASISADGIFVSSRPGTNEVTATVDGKSDTVPVVVAGDAWIENFDDMYEDGWSTVYLGPGKDPKGWNARNIHSPTYGCVYRELSSVPSALVWDGGYIWKDYSVQADRQAPEGSKFAPHTGLVFRYADKDNHYRFEQDRTIKGFRLIKQFKGKETELAKASTEVPPVILEGADARNYPSFRYYKEEYLARKKSWKYDRFKVEVKGDKIVCSLNGVEVLTAADGDLKTGTIGLYSDGECLLDNIAVKVGK